MLYMICYDVVSSRRRRKVANLLRDHGTRVQKSAFECALSTDVRLRDLLLRMRTEVDPKTDTVRVYRVCASCRTEMKSHRRQPCAGCGKDNYHLEETGVSKLVRFGTACFPWFDATSKAVSKASLERFLRTASPYQRRNNLIRRRYALQTLYQRPRSAVGTPGKDRAEADTAEEMR